MVDTQDLIAVMAFMAFMSFLGFIIVARSGNVIAPSYGYVQVPPTLGEKHNG
jgi:hypothetical protein